MALFRASLIEQLDSDSWVERRCELSSWRESEEQNENVLSCRVRPRRTYVRTDEIALQAHTSSMVITLFVQSHGNSTAISPDGYHC